MRVQTNTVSFVYAVIMVIGVGIVAFGPVLADTEQAGVTISGQVGAAVCGNGILEAGEDCDDGNASNTDACLTTCEAASCGDGFVFVGTESCDAGGSNGSCPATCSNSCSSNSCNPSGSSYNISITNTEPSYTQIEVDWTANETGTQSCTVGYDTDGGPTYDTEVVLDLSITTGRDFSYTITGLESDTLYYIAVTCIAGDGDSDIATAQETTLDVPVTDPQTITILADPELRSSTPYNHRNLDFVVRFFDSTTGEELPVPRISGITDDATGVYTGEHSVPLGTDLTAEIKGISHLSKRIIGVNTTGSTITLDFTDDGLTELLAGDVRAINEVISLPDYPGKDLLNDDYVDGADLSILLTYFATAGPEAYKILDLNREASSPIYYITEGAEISTVLSRFASGAQFNY